MRNRFVVLFAVLAGLWLPATASAGTPYLTEEAAKFHIEVFEYLDWENYEFPLTLRHCHRYNRTHISCLAKWKLEGYLDFSRDYVTLLGPNHYRVDPGAFETLLAS